MIFPFNWLGALPICSRGVLLTECIFSRTSHSTHTQTHTHKYTHIHSAFSLMLITYTYTGSMVAPPPNRVCSGCLHTCRLTWSWQWLWLADDVYGAYIAESGNIISPCTSLLSAVYKAIDTRTRPDNTNRAQSPHTSEHYVADARQKALGRRSVKANYWTLSILRQSMWEEPKSNDLRRIRWSKQAAAAAASVWLWCKFITVRFGTLFGLGRPREDPDPQNAHTIARTPYIVFYLSVFHIKKKRRIILHFGVIY